MDYSKKIKELREKMLLTQMEFAKLLDVTFETVNRWENGKNVPTMKYRRKLRELFNANGIKEE